MRRTVHLVAVLAVSAGPATAQGLISPGPSQPASTRSFDPFGPRPVFTPVVPASALPPFGSRVGGFMTIVAPVLYHPISNPPYTGYPYNYSYLGRSDIFYYAPLAPSTFLGIPPLVDPEATAGGGVQGVRVAAPATVASTGTVTIDFPAAVELWVNGVKQAGRQQSWAVTVPTAGGPATVNLLAKWTANDQAVEWEGSQTVAAGDDGRRTVLRPTAPVVAPAPRSK
jgi:hypothetical protein